MILSPKNNLSKFLFEDCFAMLIQKLEMKAASPAGIGWSPLNQ
jgi:hypothetical protein